MLLFLDGQAHYDTPRIAAKYSALSSVNATWAVTAEGRFGNCIKRTTTTTSSAAPGLVISPLMTRQGVWPLTASGVCGFAVKVDDLHSMDNSSFNPNNQIFRVIEGPSHHLRVSLNVNGTFSLIRNMGPTFEGGSGPLVIKQSTEGLSEATWAFVEFKWNIHSTTGFFELRVNGVQVLRYDGDTFAHGIGSYLGVWNAVQLVAIVPFGAAPCVVRVCDVYLADLVSNAAADVSDFLGDGSVLTIMPNGPSASGWTPNAGANWDAVNDKPAPDDDATYVATATPGTVDLYQFEDIPANAVVKGAQLSILARKETEGSGAVAPLLQPLGSGLITGPTQGVTSVVYGNYITQPYDLNPTTGGRFTAAEINGGQFGLSKVV